MLGIGTYVAEGVGEVRVAQHDGVRLGCSHGHTVQVRRQITLKDTNPTGHTQRRRIGQISEEKSNTRQQCKLTQTRKQRN